MVYFDKHERANLESYVGQRYIQRHLPDLNYLLQAAVAAYGITGDKSRLETAQAVFDLTCEYALQISGTPTGNEATRPKGPIKYTEHCGIVLWIKTCGAFLRATGEVRYADLAERCLYNAYYGSKSPDGLALQYFSAPNQLYNTDWTGPYLDGATGESKGTYRGFLSMAHIPGCCNAITSSGIPFLTENAVLQDADGAIVVAHYLPSTSRIELLVGDVISLTQETDYPYGDEVTLHFSMDKPTRFALKLRIPGWCRGASVTVNGSQYSAGCARADQQVRSPCCTPGAFFTLDREWSDGDTVQLTLDTPITLERVDQPGRVYGYTVVRGPLVYALPVPGVRERVDMSEIHYNAQMIREGQDAEALTASYNLTPAPDAIWNVALDIDLDDPEQSLEPVELASDNVLLGADTLPAFRARARRLPGWQEDRIAGKPMTPSAMPEELHPAGEDMDVTLVPFGSTSLRMTVLPLLPQDDRSKDRLLDENMV
jgi:DUF1680 family protein